MTPGWNPSHDQVQAPSRYRTWDPDIIEQATPHVKQPDLVPELGMLRLTYKNDRGGTTDERPIIVDYDSKSTGRVRRIMKWAGDYSIGQGEGQQCCLRFEVEVVKPGRGSCHHERDVVIWSQTFADVMRNEEILAALHANKVYAKELRASLIRDGFKDIAKTF